MKQYISLEDCKYSGIDGELIYIHNHKECMVFSDEDGYYIYV